MASRRIEVEIERLTQHRGTPVAEAVPALRQALTDRVNLVVAKAAKITAERRLSELIPDLLRAFDRLFENPVDRDPQCWGKNAVATALRDLEYRQAAPFLRGVRHIQLEPVWGRHEDTAQPLRGACLLALLACSDITRGEILRCLVEALTEREAVVRTEAVRGLAEIGGEEASLLLRLKARMGDAETQIVGLVFDSLFRVEGEEALEFAAAFLDAEHLETRAEAALAMGTSRIPAALAVLTKACDTMREPGLRDVLYRALSLSRSPEAVAYLLHVLQNGRLADARLALEALAIHRAIPEIRQQVDAALETGRPELRELAQHWLTE